MAAWKCFARYEQVCYVHTSSKHAVEGAALAQIERMTIVFPEPMVAQIRAAVAAGEYASTSEAVRLWSDRRQMRAQDIERLQQAWDEGKASGSAGEVDFKALRQEARQRLAALRNARGS